jgi:hypothetical protein
MKRFSRRGAEARGRIVRGYLLRVIRYWGKEVNAETLKS